MPPQSDHELLGIGPDAGPAEIRAAYITALRRLHPDTGGSAGDAQKVSELVRAYRRLRRGGRRRVSLAPMAGQPEPLPLRSFWRAGIALLIMISAAVAVAALFLIPRWDQPPARPQAEAGSGLADSAPASILEPGEALEARPDEAIVRQAVGMLQGFNPRTEAKAVGHHSMRCFSELEGQPDLRLLDYCLAFDLAVHRSRLLSPRSRNGSNYFHPDSIALRQSRALDRMIGNEEEAQRRLARIDSQVQTAIGDAISFGDPLFGPR